MGVTFVKCDSDERYCQNVMDVSRMSHFDSVTDACHINLIKVTDVCHIFVSPTDCLIKKHVFYDKLMSLDWEGF